MFYSQLLEFFHRSNPFRCFHRGRRREACIRMQEACKSHAGQGLVTESIFISVLGFGKGHFGTEALGLADLATFFKLLGAFEMFCKVSLGRFAHHNKLFAQAERKVLGRDIHEDRILCHFEFGLARVHIFLGGIVSGINLETGKDRPHNSETGVKEPVVLHFHVEIGVLDFIRRFLLFALRHLHGSVISVLAVDNAFPDFSGLGIHSGFCGFVIQSRALSLSQGFLVGFGIGAVVRCQISLRVGCGPRNIS